MDLSVRLVGDVAILDLGGRLVLGDGEQMFREKVDDLVRNDRNKILVNFRNVTYLDSAGIGAVVWKYVTLKKQGGSLKLLSLQPRSHNVLSITRLLTVLDSFDSEEEALRSFGSA